MFGSDHDFTSNVPLLHCVDGPSDIGLCERDFLRYMRFEFALINQLSYGFQIFVAMGFLGEM